ncbi:MAG: hypothetical protein C4519_19025 [Desulfobacteraceae bacterium]|nr:MAG: hypothetical protein C4519_19025 [Desulfobacteraceae bacterium]
MNAFARIGRGALIVVILLAAAGLVYVAIEGRIGGLWSDLIDEETHAATFIILFLILPVVGFPISVFLILLGAKFDPGPALLIMFSAMAVHQAITFPAGNTLLRPLIEKVLTRRNVSLPQFPKKGFIWPSIVFMAVPGLSYTLKNYILSLSGIPFGHFFLIAWLVQAMMGIPLVLAGEAVGARHFRLLMIILFIMVMIYAVRFWIIRRHKHKPE